MCSFSLAVFAELLLQGDELRRELAGLYAEINENKRSPDICRVKGLKKLTASRPQTVEDSDRGPIKPLR